MRESDDLTPIAVDALRNSVICRHILHEHDGLIDADELRYRATHYIDSNGIESYKPFELIDESNIESCSTILNPSCRLKQELIDKLNMLLKQSSYFKIINEVYHNDN